LIRAPASGSKQCLRKLQVLSREACDIADQFEIFGGLSVTEMPKLRTVTLFARMCPSKTKTPPIEAASGPTF
jgi:hypothetical protein